MNALIFRFFDICLLRAGPQDLPASMFLLRVAIATNIVFGSLMAYPDRGMPQAFIEVLFDFALLTLLLYGVLHWRQKAERFSQTLTALMGTNVILSFFAMPVVYTITGAPEGETAGWALQMFLLLVIWNITVMAHILRHSLEMHIGYTLVMSVGYVVLAGFLTLTLFGGTA